MAPLAVRIVLIVLAVYFARRALLALRKKPKLAREDWALYRDRGSAPIELSLLLLDERLRHYGYAPVILEGKILHATIRQAGRRAGGVTIDITKLMTEGFGTVEVMDDGSELYSEMAKYAMLELGRLVPGTTYRDAYSALLPESTETLEPLLPEKPHYL